MRARLILETGNWNALHSTHLPHPVHLMHMRDAGNGMPASNTWIFIAGYSAARLGDLKTAEAAEAQLRGAREKARRRARTPTQAKPVAIMEKQVGALVRSARGQKDEALKLAKEAMEIELSLSAPSGPPDPIKPAPEFYGELLLEAGKHPEAVAALELSLQRTPNRTPSVKAMQRARVDGHSNAIIART